MEEKQTTTIDLGLEFSRYQQDTYQLLNTHTPGSPIVRNRLLSLISVLKTHNNLCAAFLILCSIKGRVAAGIDKVKPNEVREDPSRYVGDIPSILKNFRIRQSSNLHLTFSDVKVVVIPKTDGKDRILRILTVRDSALLYLALQIITPYIEYSLDSFSLEFPRCHILGARAGISTYDAILRLKEIHTQAPASNILLVDISACFESISFDKIRQYLITQAPQLAPFLNLADLAYSIAQPTSVNNQKVLAQGFCTSPAFCNTYIMLVLRSFFQKFPDHYQSYQSFTWLDDLTFVGPGNIFELHNDIVNHFLSHGLTIKPAKTKFIYPAKHNECMLSVKYGQVLGYKIYSRVNKRSPSGNILRILVGASPHKDPIQKRILEFSRKINALQFKKGDKLPKVALDFLAVVRGHLSYYSIALDSFGYTARLRKWGWKYFRFRYWFLVSAGCICKKSKYIKNKTHPQLISCLATTQ